MAGEKHTLLIITPGFPSDEGDTTCLPTQQLLVKALKRNYPALDIIVVTLQYPFRKDEYLWNGIKVISFDSKGEKGLRRPVSWLNIWRRLQKLNTTHSISGIFSFWCSETAFIGKRFAKRYDIPHYIWIPGQDARKGNKYIPLIKPAADELVAISDAIADEFNKNYGVKPVHILPNGIEPAMYNQTPQSRDIDLLCVGSLVPLKQHDIFIDAVAAIKKIIPGIKAVICGAGPEEGRLKQKAQQLCGDSIRFASELPHNEVIGMMQKAKVLLHPSSYEGFSTVCLEALYAGAHVASFCRPMDEDIPHWHIVKNKEEMELTALALLQDGSTEYTRVSKYTMDQNAEMVMKLFRFV